MSEHSLLVKTLPCLACQMERIDQPCPTEAHHLNMFGLAGKKRRGDADQVPLCGWHHRGVLLPHRSSTHKEENYGPSLALRSRAFRTTYGSDNALLAQTNSLLGLTVAHDQSTKEP